MATKELAVEQKEIRKVILVMVNELRDHLGAPRVRAFLWSATKSTNKDSDLIGSAVQKTPLA